ncbi:MAG TPA: hypothetical protein VHS78_14750 [Candidatus Elarobacter sp.]|jgi:hypothetical protein|nr:hypothetical protein [Candidatus Elarobacter sp.]
MKSRALAIAALVLLAGCGGGGGSSPATNPAPTTPQQPSGNLQTVNMTISFPIGAKPSSSKRAPQYVSPNTKQIRVQINSVTNNGTTTNSGSLPSWIPTDVTTALVFAPTAGSNCTVSGGTATCTIPVAAPPGTVNYTITAEWDTGHASAPLARKTLDVPITQGANNTPTVTLLGIVATVNASLPALTADTAQSAASVTWSALDASGAQIVGPDNFENAITLTDTDATLQTKLHVNGGAAAASVTLTKPGDAVTLDYTGQADNPFSLTASGTGITGGGSVTPTVFDVTFTGLTLDDANHGGLSGDPNWSQPTMFFSGASGSQNVTGTEKGWTNPGSTLTFNQQFTLDTVGDGSANWCASGSNPNIASFSASPATTFTITATGNGICKVRLLEAGTGYPITTHAARSGSTDTTHDGTFWISVTTGNFTINGKRHQPQ